jgi:hypothetical protein
MVGSDQDVADARPAIAQHRNPVGIHVDGYDGNDHVDSPLATEEHRLVRLVEELAETDPQVQIAEQRDLVAAFVLELAGREVLDVLLEVESGTGWWRTIEEAGEAEIHGWQRLRHPHLGSQGRGENRREDRQRRPPRSDSAPLRTQRLHGFPPRSPSFTSEGHAVKYADTGGDRCQSIPGTC